MALWANSRHGSMRAATSGPRSGVDEAPAIISTSTVMYPASRSVRKMSVATSTSSPGEPAPATMAPYCPNRSSLTASSAANNRLATVPKW